MTRKGKLRKGKEVNEKKKTRKKAGMMNEKKKSENVSTLIASGGREERSI